MFARLLIACLCGVVLCGRTLANLAIEDVGQKFTLKLPDYADMSGVTWRGDEAFYVVRDGGTITSNGCYLHLMTPVRDNRGGLIEMPRMSKGVLLQGAHDVEGVARDPFNGMIWVSDEYDTSIREYDPETGLATGRQVAVPNFVVQNVRGNLSLESLAISPDGLTLWTANEEALECDGPRASSKRGTTVRLMRFTRKEPRADWEAAGMWAYVCEPCGSVGALNSGVSDLCVLPDDSLLVLERECSYETLGLTRIFRPSFTNATDVSTLTSLKKKSTYTPVEKGAALYTLRDGDFFGGGVLHSDVACYEGLCTGPRNADGTLCLMLVSDGGATGSRTKWGLTATVRTQPYVRALALRGMDEKGRTIPALAKAFFEPFTTWEDCRLGIGGFGRGGISVGKSRGELYGAEADYQHLLFSRGGYALRLGVGGAFSPRQMYASASDGRLAYGELRTLAIPERRLTENLTFGMRLGVAFNWLNARTAAVEDETEFSAQGIVGLQATYELTDHIGLYSGFDWRLGDATSYGHEEDKTEVDLSGWLWNAGVFFSF